MMGAIPGYQTFAAFHAMPSFPKIVPIRQRFDAVHISDVAAAMRLQLERLDLAAIVRPGASVAITAGSRGIDRIDAILQSIVDYFLQIGAEPFLVPAMGSHGGGTVPGQLAILAALGITEQSMGCPIRATMETDVVARAPEGFDVHIDRHACRADHVVVCGRVKPHTGFTGDIQSGLMKMMLTGLGKHNGARLYHQATVDHEFGQIVRSVAAEVLARCRVVAGVAIVENALARATHIEAVPPQQFEARERELLRLATVQMARLPFDSLDVLLVDEIGKDVSGTGMDTNVIGRKYNDHAASGDERPRIKRIVVRGLSKKTNGNGNGIGLAEFCVARVLDQIDLKTTQINAVTANHMGAGMLPPDLPTDEAALDAALNTIGLTPREQARVAWIKSTKELETLWVSEALLPEIASRPDLEVLGPPQAFPFAADGNLACSG